MSEVTGGVAASLVSYPQDVIRITQAFDFAARVHVDQRRKGEREEPYLNHLAEVAHLVAEATGGNDANLVIASLLHDSIEDAGVTRAELVENFGEDVASLVAEVTDDKKLPKAERKRLQIETAPKKSSRAKIIKIADKIANLKALATSPPPDWDEARRREYVIWSSRVVDGCWGVNAWLEDRYQEACKFADSPPDARLARLRESLANLPVIPAYRSALLASVDRYADQILGRPEFGAGWDDLFAIQQVTLGDAMEDQHRSLFQGGGPIKVGGCVHHLKDLQSLQISSSFEFTVRVSQLPSVVEQLRTKGKHASWVVFMFYTPIASVSTDDQCINLQYSVDDDRVGLDFVLLGPRNIEDKKSLAKFIASKGHAVTEMELNEVCFLRVEDGEVAALGVSIATEFYQLERGTEIGLLFRGFEYEPCKAAPVGLHS